MLRCQVPLFSVRPVWRSGKPTRFGRTAVRSSRSERPLPARRVGAKRDGASGSTGGSFDLAPSEIEGWVEDAKRGMENSLRAHPLDIREHYEKQLKDLQEAYGEAMLELRARKKLQARLDGKDGN